VDVSFELVALSARSDSTAAREEASDEIDPLDPLGPHLETLLHTHSAQMRRPPPPMLPEEFSAVEAEFLALGVATGSDSFSLTAPAGGRAECVGLSERGFKLSIEGSVSPQLAELVHRVLLLGNLFLFSVRPYSIVAVTEEQLKGLPTLPTGKRGVVCGSPPALARQLERGLADYLAWRKTLITI
jgi:hypothetical protein